MSYEILHNPRCSKSRQTLALLQENGTEPNVILYLESTPSKKRLKEIASMLDVKPIAMTRTNETRFKELGLAKDDNDGTLFDALAKNPILIERPIVIKDNKRAVIGRPPENVLSLL